MSLPESDLDAFKAFEKAGWERAADPYHQHWGNLSRQSAEAMVDAAGVAPGTRVLDVATGAGYVAAAAARRGAHAIGLDFSSAQVELARATFAGAEFRQGDAEQLPFDANTFDAVVIGFDGSAITSAGSTYAIASAGWTPGSPQTACTSAIMPGWPVQSPLGLQSHAATIALSTSAESDLLAGPCGSASKF